MASISSFPNNSSTYVGAEPVMKWLHGRTSGVFAAGNNCAVTAAGGMGLSVSAGIGWLSNSDGNGIAWWTDSAVSLTVDQADSYLPRIDRVIVEWKTTNYVDLPEIKMLKGTAASSPSAPALTNTATLRQISLARIAVASGATTITAANITDERLNSSVCGLVTDSITIDTTEMQSQFTALLNSIKDQLESLEAGTAVELKKLMFTDETVAASTFVSDSTYESYPYRAAVALAGVLDDMVPEVIFGVEDSHSGMFAHDCESYDGGVYIYATEKPSATITIPVIIAWRS